MSERLRRWYPLGPGTIAPSAQAPHARRLKNTCSTHQTSSGIQSGGQTIRGQCTPGPDEKEQKLGKPLPQGAPSLFLDSYNGFLSYCSFSSSAGVLCPLIVCPPDWIPEEKQRREQGRPEIDGKRETIQIIQSNYKHHKIDGANNYCFPEPWLS